MHSVEGILISQEPAGVIKTSMRDMTRGPSRFVELSLKPRDSVAPVAQRHG